jgi:hypothetical protein
MYHVVFMEADECLVKKVVFRSKIEASCWNFIQFRLQADSAKVRTSANQLYVLNALDEFCEPPDHIRALKRYHNQKSA